MDMANRSLATTSTLPQDIRPGVEFDVDLRADRRNGQRWVPATSSLRSFTNRGEDLHRGALTPQTRHEQLITTLTAIACARPYPYARGLSHVSARASPWAQTPNPEQDPRSQRRRYAAPRGQANQRPPGDGKVLLAGRRGGYGNTVIIQHGKRLPYAVRPYARLRQRRQRPAEPSSRAR